MYWAQTGYKHHLILTNNQLQKWVNFMTFCWYWDHQIMWHECTWKSHASSVWLAERGTEWHLLWDFINKSKPSCELNLNFKTDSSNLWFCEFIVTDSTMPYALRFVYICAKNLNASFNKMSNMQNTFWQQLKCVFGITLLYVHACNIKKH